ncbi:hypothetical protein [Geminocystis sp. NIES-3709]|uniref:hypothetical protein n=1 Tax=Geminocystis sp. NIES-3709 TaxID=1617448 RepID=UPI0005FC8BE7|nr:hypothetical protein [Geminocystis sp. NIES-3709]BAQ65206.1 hypothetical protein GM3709_1971 [Geminocystis sp. NIES-3709]
MKKIPLLVISSLFLLTGCGLFGGGEDTSSTPPIPENSTPTPTPEITETPETTPNNNQIIGSTGGLIPPTNSQERLRQINQGRNDPFNSFNPPPVIKVREDQPLSKSLTKNAIIRVSAPSSESGTDFSEVNVNGRTIARGVGAKDRNAVNAVNNVHGGGIGLCENPTEGITSFPEPEIVVSGIINVNGRSVAIIKLGEEAGFRRVYEGESIVYENSVLFVRQISAYNLQPNIILAATPNFVNFSGEGLSGGVLFGLPDGSTFVKRVGEKAQIDSEQKEPPAFKTNLNKDRFNIKNRERDGIKLINLEDVVPKIVNIGSEGQTPKQTVEISGFVCNNTNKTLRVSSLIFTLSIGNVALPPLTGYFQGLQQGDLSQGDAAITQQARLILKGQKTLFRGTIGNIDDFQGTQKIDMNFEGWN